MAQVGDAHFPHRIRHVEHPFGLLCGYQGRQRNRSLAHPGGDHET